VELTFVYEVTRSIMTMAYGGLKYPQPENTEKSRFHYCWNFRDEIYFQIHNFNINNEVSVKSAAGISFAQILRGLFRAIKLWPKSPRPGLIECIQNVNEKLSDTRFRP
jgi:hypothetical protein